MSVGAHASLSKHLNSPWDEVAGFEIGNGQIIKFTSPDGDYSFYLKKGLETFVDGDKLTIQPPNVFTEIGEGIEIQKEIVDPSDITKMVSNWLTKGGWSFDVVGGKNALRRDKYNAKGELQFSEIRVFKSKLEVLLVRFNKASGIQDRDFETILDTFEVKNIHNG